MPSAPKRRARPRETSSVRMSSEDRRLIDRAAKVRGTSRADFILDAARRTAEDTLLERALTPVSANAYADFLARLDEPTEPNEELRRTMQAAPPWKTLRGTL